MSWSHLRGHQRQLDAFRHVVAKGRLAHGYLFVGPSGIGKRLFARNLAKALLCENPPPDTPLTSCDACAACLLVDAETHPDLFMVRRPEEKNEFPIELMMELCRGFSLKSARGHGKVAILEDADDLNEESANCFLKTLEEPPPRSVFILIGSSVDRQLATILSRCQTVRFAPLADADVRELLRQRDLTDPATLERLVKLAGGSPGQALELADEGLWRFRQRLLQTLSQPGFDAVELAKEFITFAEEAGKEGALQRRRAALVLRLLLEALSDTLAVTYGAPTRSAAEADLPLLRALAERAQPDTLAVLVERCLETEAQINRYVQLALVLEGLLDGFAQILEKPALAPVRLGGRM